MVSTILKYTKAVAGGLTAGAAALATAMASGPITLGEWLTVLGAVVAGGGLVAWVPNRTTSPPK